MPIKQSSLSDQEIEDILVRYDAHIDAEEGSAGHEIYQAAWTDLHEIADPDTRLRVLEIVSRLDLKRQTLLLLGCGFLEDLLDHHGEAVIQRIEDIAATSEAVRYMLTCVWYYSVDETVYVRVREIVDRLGPPQAEFWREPKAESRAQMLEFIAKFYSD